jgi:hypothetical protein
VSSSRSAIHTVIVSIAKQTVTDVDLRSIETPARQYGKYSVLDVDSKIVKGYSLWRNTVRSRGQQTLPFLQSPVTRQDLAQLKRFTLGPIYPKFTSRSSLTPIALILL